MPFKLRPRDQGCIMTILQPCIDLITYMHHRLMRAESERDDVLSKLSCLPPVLSPCNDTDTWTSIIILRQANKNLAARHDSTANLHDLIPATEGLDEPHSVRPVIFAHIFLNDSRERSLSTEMLAVQLARALLQIFVDVELHDRRLQDLAAEMRVHYQGLRKGLLSIQEWLCYETFLSAVVSADTALERNQEDCSKLRHEGKEEEMLGQLWADLLQRHATAFVLKAFYEPYLLTLLRHIDELGIQVRRQAMITEYVEVEWTESGGVDARGTGVMDQEPAAHQWSGATKGVWQQKLITNFYCPAER